jgi:hypothetical protein
MRGSVCTMVAASLNITTHCAPSRPDVQRASYVGLRNSVAGNRVRRIMYAHEGVSHLLSTAIVWLMRTPAMAAMPTLAWIDWEER